MFEYLMPMLFLPLYRASLLYESAHFCLYVQKRRRLPGKPWGISESAFYSLDASLSYRYKAHGCPALALKRGQEADLVIAPYASFLALSVEPLAAVRNLRRLRELGAVGRWGYIEALDFTPGRCLNPDGEQVRCWMAHHVGMSILAALNAFDGGTVRELFLSEPSMAAFTLLLQEKLPDSPAVLRRDASPVPERPAKDRREPWTAHGQADGDVRACLLSNGIYSLRVKSTGESAAFLCDTCVYRAEGDDPGLRLTLGSQAYLPEKWEFSEECCRWEAFQDGVCAALTRKCAEGELGESLALMLTADRTRSLPVTLCLAPVLAAERDWESHRAYWQLGMQAEVRDGRLLLRRLSKHGEPERFLCLAADHPAVFDADARGGLGALLSPLLRVRVDVTLHKGCDRTLRFVIALGNTAQDAFDAAGRVLEAPSGSSGSMVRAAALRLGMSGEELDEAMGLVLPLWENRLCGAEPKSTLWCWGISGDYPLLCCRAGATERDRLLRAFCLLKCCGLESELVYLTDEQGEYRRPALREIEARLTAYGLEALMSARGGVLSAPTSAVEVLRDRAAVFIGEEKKLHWVQDSFVYEIKSLPPRIWQHVLTNGSLSAFAADFGPAGLWLQNAREMRLLPPPEDIRAAGGTEAVYALVGGEAVSLFADGQSHCEVSYAPGLAAWHREIAGREIETTLLIPMGLDVRILHAHRRSRRPHPPVGRGRVAAGNGAVRRRVRALRG